MKILIEGTPKEITALVQEIQERQDEETWISIRAPYQRHRTLVRTGTATSTNRKENM